MKSFLLIISFLTITFQGLPQSFLDEYRQYKLSKIPKSSTVKTKKMLAAYTKSHIAELDTIFHSYNVRKKFDFNNADSLFIIYQAPVESPFTSDIIIWSGSDTISYTQQFRNVNSSENKRVAIYAPFRYSFQSIPGYKEITERDSLITLVSKRDMKTAMHLGDGQRISDGSDTIVYIASKKKGRYLIESWSLPQFTISTTYRKE